MGLFGGGYSTPGPGIDKNAPKKKGLFLYGEIFFRKFWKIVQVNLIYFMLSLLFIALMYILAPISGTFVESLVSLMETTSDNIQEITGSIQVSLRSLFAISVLGLWGFAPLMPGYAYVMRCFTREQHSWVWSDFREKIKENIKQSMVVFLIDIVFYLLSFNALRFYSFAFKGSGQGIWFFACCIIVTLIFIYTVMHFYIYQIMVTFKCSIKQLYRNAAIMTFAKLPMNILLTFIALLLNYLVFSTFLLNPAISLILSLFIWVSVVRFPIEFYATRVIQKQIIDNDQLVSKPDDSKRERKGK